MQVPICCGLPGAPAATCPARCCATLPRRLAADRRRVGLPAVRRARRRRTAAPSAGRAESAFAAARCRSASFESPLVAARRAAQGRGRAAARPPSWRALAAERRPRLAVRGRRAVRAVPALAVRTAAPRIRSRRRCSPRRSPGSPASPRSTPSRARRRETSAPWTREPSTRTRGRFDDVPAGVAVPAPRALSSTTCSRPARRWMRRRPRCCGAGAEEVRARRRSRVTCAR